MDRKPDLPSDLTPTRQGLPGDTSSPSRDAPTAIPDEALEGAPDSLSLDARFGARYRMTDLLGAGGMGEVRLCDDAIIGRAVAMKVVRSDVGKHIGRRERFLREARIQGQLEHPAVVPVYDLGNHPSGGPYFTMKRVHGASLQEILDGLRAGRPGQGKQHSRRKLLSAVSSVCLAVDFAHARGVVHRDLKPSNIMLGDFGEVYVLDWGLARHIERPELDEAAQRDLGDDEPTRVDATPPAQGSDSARTEHGVMLGTPGYMAPEQVRGERDRLDARTDVYALGAILFEVLALEPFNPPTPMVMALAQTLSGVEARPSVRAPAREVPPELEAICVTATRVDPAQRFQTARAMHEAIEHFLDGDRDIERRRELSARHGEEAAAATERALRAAGAVAMEARKQAMREVGRALALDADNRGALATMMRLLTELPDQTPREVEASITEADAATVRAITRVGFVAYLALLSFVPLALWMGVREWRIGVAGPALVTAATALAYRVSRTGTSRTPWGLLVIGLLGVASSSAVFGPYVGLPGLAAINGMGFFLRGGQRMGLVMALAMMPVLLPALLEWAGLLPPSMRFAAGHVELLPRALSFPPVPTTIMLLLLSLAEVFFACWIVWYVRQRQRDVERRLQITLWQLRQLVPDEATPGAAAAGARGGR